MSWRQLGVLVATITIKDCTEYRNQIVFATTANGLAAASWMVDIGVSRGYLRGFLFAMVCFAPIAYAQFCFHNERQRGTLPILLGLPLRAESVVYAKYASMGLISLLTISGPLMVSESLGAALTTAGAALFFGTFAMSFTVISEKPWAFQIPLWVLLGFGLILVPLLSRTFPSFSRSLADDYAGVAVAILILSIPAIVVLSTRWFCRNSIFSGRR